MQTVLPAESPENSAKLDWLCERGCTAFRKRQYRRAVRHFEEAVTAAPEDARVRKLLGTACAYTRDFRTAAIHFHRMTQIVPRDSVGYLNLGAILNASSEYGGAIRVLKRGLYMTNGNTRLPEEFYYNMGLAYRHSDQEPTAVKCYLECLRLKPDLTAACINLANIYCRQQDYEHAHEYYSKVLDIDGVDPTDHARAMLGIKYVKAAQSGGEATEMPVSSPGLVVGGTVANEEFPESADNDEEFVRSLSRAATLGDDVVMYLRMKVQPLLENVSSAADGAETSGKHPGRQFGDTVQFLDMMFEQLKTEHQLMRKVGPAPNENVALSHSE